MKWNGTNKLFGAGRGLSRADEERLLTGKTPEGEGLQDLVSAVEALRCVGKDVPGEAEAEAFGAEAAKLVAGVQAQKPSQVSAVGGASSRRKRRLRAAFVGSLGTLALLLGVATGVAYASNDAAPGDTLYGLDRALETIGLWDGGLQERLGEATKLCERGEVEKGLNHAAAAVQNQAGLDDSGEANSALARAADAVQTSSQGESEQVRAQVKELLSWMATTETMGEEFGRGVTERTQAISGEAGMEQDETGTDAGGAAPGSGETDPGSNGGNGQH